MVQEPPPPEPSDVTGWSFYDVPVAHKVTSGASVWKFPRGPDSHTDVGIPASVWKFAKGRTAHRPWPNPTLTWEPPHQCGNLMASATAADPQRFGLPGSGVHGIFKFHGFVVAWVRLVSGFCCFMGSETIWA